MKRPYQRGLLLAKFFLFSRSFPLARPRFSTTKHVYQPLKNQECIISELKHYAAINLDGAVLLDVIFYFRKKGNGDYPISPSIGDLDNHVKAISDNLVKAHILSDDRIIVDLHASKCWAKEDYIQIEIYEVIPNDIQIEDPY